MVCGMLIKFIIISRAIACTARELYLSALFWGEAGWVPVIFEDIVSCFHYSCHGCDLGDLGQNESLCCSHIQAPDACVGCTLRKYTECVYASRLFLRKIYLPAILNGALSRDHIRYHLRLSLARATAKCIPGFQKDRDRSRCVAQVCSCLHHHLESKFEVQASLKKGEPLEDARQRLIDNESLR